MRTVQSYSPGVANVHPHLVRSIGICILHCTSTAPCWVALSISTAGHVRVYPGSAPFCPQNCPSHGWSKPPSNIWFTLGPLKSTSKWHLDWFNHFWMAHYCDRLTDHTTPSVAIGRIHLALGCNQSINLCGSIIIHVIIMSTLVYRKIRIPWIPSPGKKQASTSCKCLANFVTVSNVTKKTAWLYFKHDMQWFFWLLK